MKNAFYLSGMFAGGYIWDRAQPLIDSKDHKVLMPALCEISGRLDELMEEISAEIAMLLAKLVCTCSRQEASGVRRSSR